MKINSRDFESRKIKIAFVLPNLRGGCRKDNIEFMFKSRWNC